LLDDPSELDPDTIRALEAGLDEGTPQGAKAAVWGALAAALPKAAAAATAASGGAAAAAATATAGVSFVKMGAIGVALGTLSGVGVFATQRATAPESPGSAQVAPATPRASAAAGARAVVKETPRAEPSPPETEANAPAVREQSDTSRAAPEEAPRAAEALLAESRRVATARSLLRRGSAADALSALVAVEREFPNGMLAQEREALTIEALAALGHRELVQQRAARFLSRYAASPHAEAVRRAAE
jgi:hypothetical protein